MFGTFEDPKDLHDFIEREFLTDRGRASAWLLAAMVHETCSKAVECPHCTTQFTVETKL